MSNIAGFSSSGDLVYDPVNNRFLATSAGHSLWSLALDGTATSTGPQTSVPEPATVFGLLGVGALGVGSLLKRKQQHKA